MLCKVAINIIRRSICNNAPVLYYTQNNVQSVLMTYHNNIIQYNVQNNYNVHVMKRFKSHKKSHKKASDNVINIIIYLYFHLYFYCSFIEFLHISKNIF